VICLNINKIVPNMHEAYQQVDVAKEGYGVFLAGPSKTADIEQSLVIGAHGARSLLVYLIS
jgi:L-lactate dehydrogenase complex protein LldG